MRNRGSTPRFLAVIVLAVIFGVGGAKADTHRGKALAKQWCSGCHSVAPNEPAGDPAAPDFAEVAAEPSATGYALRVFLRTPHATMPNFVLDSDDIDDLVSYILTLKRRR
jgi:mono/diheme cytochrome c family protein